MPIENIMKIIEFSLTTYHGLIATGFVLVVAAIVGNMTNARRAAAYVANGGFTPRETISPGVRYLTILLVTTPMIFISVGAFYMITNPVGTHVHMPDYTYYALFQALIIYPIFKEIVNFIFRHDEKSCRRDAMNRNSSNYVAIITDLSLTGHWTSKFVVFWRKASDEAKMAWVEEHHQKLRLHETYYGPLTYNPHARQVITSIDLGLPPVTPPTIFPDIY